MTDQELPEERFTWNMLLAAVAELRGPASELLGVGLLIAGLWWAWPPLALIAAGVLVLARRALAWWNDGQ